MGINEPFRCIVVGHARLIGALLALSLGIAFLTVPMSSTEYVASARIQASSATLGSDTEADSVLNRVSGVATSPTIVAAALTAARITGRNSATTAAHEVSVARLGSSAVMDVRVTDRNRQIARRLADALATAVVGFIDNSGVAAPNGLISRLTEQESELTNERAHVVSELATTTDIRTSATLSGQLSTIDQQRGDVASTLRQLQVAVATDSSASVISTAGPAVRVSSSSALDIVLIGVAGLVLALLAAAVFEMARPRLAGAQAVARELDAPVLGRLSLRTGRQLRKQARKGLLRRRPTVLSDDTATSPRLIEIDPATVVSIRRAAVRAEVATLVLVAGSDRIDTASVVAELTARLGAGHPSSNGRVAVPGAILQSKSTGSFKQAGSSTATATATAVKQRSQPERATAPTPRLRVVSIKDVEAHPPVDGCRLVVWPCGFTSLAAVQRIQDLSVATGWQVVGVLDGSRNRAGRTQS